MTTLALFALLVPLVAWAVHRDVRRAVRRRRMLQLAAPIRRDFEAFQRAIGEALLPSMQEAARAISRAFANRPTP